MTRRKHVGADDIDDQEDPESTIDVVQRATKFQRRGNRRRPNNDEVPRLERPTEPENEGHLERVEAMTSSACCASLPRHGELVRHPHRERHLFSFHSKSLSSRHCRCRLHVMLLLLRLLSLSTIPSSIAFRPARYVPFTDHSTSSCSRFPGFTLRPGSGAGVDRS